MPNYKCERFSSFSFYTLPIVYVAYIMFYWMLRCDD